MIEKEYLKKIKEELQSEWPENRIINIVCHGHSVPSGYFKTPEVNLFSAYPHLLHVLVKKNYPYASLNVIVTAIGGEKSDAGNERFNRDVLCHQPDVITIDYSLNDRIIGLEKAEKSWRGMIEKALDKNCKVILLTPNFDDTYIEQNDSFKALGEQAKMVRSLALEYQVGLCDTYKIYEQYMKTHNKIYDLLSQSNHPNELGHRLIAAELAKYFT